MGIVFKQPKITIFRPESYASMLERCTRMTCVCKNWGMEDPNFNNVASMENYVRIHRDKLHHNIFEHADFSMLFFIPNLMQNALRMHRIASILNSTARYDWDETPTMSYFAPPIFPNLKNDVEYTVQGNAMFADLKPYPQATKDEIDFVQSLELADKLGRKCGDKHYLQLGTTYKLTSLKTNIREIRFIVSVRSGAVTDRADATDRNVFGPLLAWLKENYPVFFEDIRSTQHSPNATIEVMP